MTTDLYTGKREKQINTSAREYLRDIAEDTGSNIFFNCCMAKDFLEIDGLVFVSEI